MGEPHTGHVDDDDDDSFLDEAFDRVFEELADGVAVDLDEIAAERPHLRGRLEETLRLAQQVSVRASPMVPALPGYSIIGELGHGGMGVVYLARQDRLGGRLVALKVLPLSASMASSARARFLNEANALARLRHPHVVAIHDVIEDGPTCAYVMEWVDGRSLAEVVARLEGLDGRPSLAHVSELLEPPDGAIPGPDLVRYLARAAASIADALSAVHEAGLLHRDVKPSNILLRRDGTALLSDFGLVRDTDLTAITVTGQFVGTPAYAAPEQLRGEESLADARSDIYSLGMTLYHALALRLPFPGASTRETLAEIEHGDGIPLRRAVPGVPRALDIIVSTAIHPDPAHRYQSAAELSGDLERFLDDEPILARPEALPSRIRRRIRRQRTPVLAAVTGAAGVAGFLLILFLAGLAPFAGTPEEVPPFRLTMVEPAGAGGAPQAMFEDTGQALGNGDTLSVALGDLDADGDLDLATGNLNQPDRVWLNDDGGRFIDSGQALGTGNTRCVEIADMDGDNVPDLVCGRIGENRVWLNDGEGRFSRFIPFPDAQTSYGLAIGDIDGDGDLDLIEANKFGNFLLLNDGTGALERQEQRLGTNISGVALADLDGDGNLDLFDGAVNRVWFNDGTGSFRDDGVRLGSGPSIGVAVGDLNGDGSLDVIATHPSRARWPAWFNDGKGRFVASEHLIQRGSGTATFADLDGDGDLDLLLAGGAAVAGSACTNNGSGAFVRSDSAFGTARTRDLAVGDVDGDGRPDIITGNTGGPNRVWRNISPPGPSTRRAAGEAPRWDIIVTRLAIGDLDGDKDLDLVCHGGPGSTIEIWLNDGAGGYRPSPGGLDIPVNAMPLDLELADLDLDGDLDLVLANEHQPGWDGHPNRVWLNDGSARFHDSGQRLGKEHSHAIAIGDLDGDLLPDLVAGNQNDPNRVWLNDGGGLFRDSGQRLGSAGTRSVALADLDGDGDLDLACGNFYGEPTVLWRNDGSGSFEAWEQFGASSTFEIALGDFDDDGDVDLIEGNATGEENILWSNDGAGHFEESGQHFGTGEPDVLATADLDLDGDVDIIVSGMSSNACELWLNRGDGSFTSAGAVLEHSHVFDIEIGDLDGDGDPDIFSAHGREGIRQWMNDIR